MKGVVAGCFIALLLPFLFSSIILFCQKLKIINVYKAGKIINFCLLLEFEVFCIIALLAVFASVNHLVNVLEDF